MTPAEAAVRVEVADDEDVKLAIEGALTSAGVTFDELRRQAVCSRFQSERARTAWFVISPFLAR